MKKNKLNKIQQTKLTQSTINKDDKTNSLEQSNEEVGGSNPLRSVLSCKHYVNEWNE